MHKTNGAGHIANMYVNEDVALSRPPTEVPAVDLNAFQEELVNIATMNGETLLTPGTDTFTQARDAIITKIRNMINGGDYKDSVRFTTTANIVLTSLGTQAGGDWPAVLTAGERILVKNQTAGLENGIWIAAAGAWTRSTDADTGAELNSGAIIPVESGTLNADTTWQLTTDGTVVVGTNALTFAFLENPIFSQYTSVTYTAPTRSFATTYTNTSKRPKLVEVFASSTAIGQYLTCAALGSSAVSSSSVATQGLAVSMVVLPNATYSVTQSGIPTYTLWREVQL